MTSDGTRRLIAPLALVALLAAACADFSRGEPAAPDGGGNDAATEAGDGGALSFATSVYPLLQSGCAGCHAPGQEASDTGLLFTGDAAADLASVLRFVETAAPASSRLVTKMSGSGHGGGAVYAPGSPEYLTIVDWIQTGASP